LELGSFNDRTRQFDGIIDDVRICDQTLNQADLDFLVLQPPVLTIAPTGVGLNSISWQPDTPGYMLQETANLSPATWTNAPSGSTNPAIIPAKLPTKYYRLIKP
jgi:hypothetical protein